MASYPFATELAFRTNVTNLCPDLKGPTGDFWRCVENDLRSRSLSIDEITNLRDYIWFSEKGERSKTDVPLEALLRSIAARCLRVDGATVWPRLPEELQTPDSSGADSRIFWQWIALSLPPDLLLAAIEKGPPPCRRVATVSPRLDRMLKDRGFGQLHLHFGAASEFTDLWVGVLLVMAHSRLDASDFRSPGAAFNEGQELGEWLARAALVRVLMGAFLTDRDAREMGFAQWVQGVLASELRATGAALLQAVARELVHGRLEPEHGIKLSEVRGLYARLSGATVWKEPTCASEIQQLDPIARYFPASESPVVPTPEIRFVAAGLWHLEDRAGKGKKDALFESLFWQVIRVRGIFYQHLVQRPLTPGLQWFFRFYGRIRTARAWGTKVQIESTAQLEGIGHGLRYLELRTAPSESVSEHVTLFKDTELAARSLQERCERVRDHPVEVGLILHFTRDRGGHAAEGRLGNRWADSYADPRHKRTGWRYSIYYQKKKREALALATAIQRHPSVLFLLRGLDICTDEAGVPTWVLVPVFQYVHAAGREASSFLQEMSEETAPALRSTVHAGEDFAHLLTGLRRVTEAMEFLPLQEGDRLGHAMALGLDPLDWAKRTGSVVMPKEERLFDLVWEWGWYSLARVSPPDGRRVSHLMREIARLSQEIFGKPHPADRLEKMVEDLHKPEVLCQVGFPSGRPFRGGVARGEIEDRKRRNLLVQFLTDPVVFQNGHELEWIRTEPEGEALATIQSELIRHVGAHGIVIEANPSSNFLIGDLRDLGRHPLWRLSPPRDGTPLQPISVCIGSDDPVTFATTLREEYQKLIDTLVVSGLSQEEAERWLERVRAQGCISQFTLPPRPLDEPESIVGAPPRRRFENSAALP
ncbi:MAG TPA: hypothetical protein VGP73_29615 [Thermoanaerobaculia bacterium]